MKIVAILESEISAGGGFNQALNAILQMVRICEGRHEFEILTTKRCNIDPLKQIGINAALSRMGWSDHLLCDLAENPVWHKLQQKLRIKGCIERHLDKIGCDLAYFVVPSLLPLTLQTTPYLTTVWDLCHRDQPEFPEVRCYGQFQQRERMLRLTLPLAVGIISDSPQLSDLLTRRYNLDSQRILAVPFSPAPQAKLQDVTNDEGVLKKHQLQPGYFFYPAQLWAHKNHSRIIEAVALQRERNLAVQVVFAGGDKGMREYLIGLAKTLKVKNCIKFLGFVPSTDMNPLYRQSRAVIMPSYFGPTNLPPLEAWSLDRPLIYSNHLSGQVGDAALLVDPDDAHSIAEAMCQCFDERVVEQLVQNGRRRLTEIDSQRNAAETSLTTMIERFSQRHRCWST